GTRPGCSDRDPNHGNHPQPVLAGTSRPTPFTFLMIELASGEGCEGVAEAARRLELATGDIQGAAEAIQRAGSPAR
ncbi:hypothetical protein ABTK37_20010, partial [Acinetobacter baumannii]